MADVDGDGRAEIAIADVNALNVIEPFGFVRWTVSHTTSVYSVINVNHCSSRIASFENRTQS